MSAHRLAVCLATLGWSARELARRTGQHRTEVMRQLDGRQDVAPDIAAWIERLTDAHLRNPCPRRRMPRLAGQMLS